MKKIIVSIIVIGLLLTTSLVTVNAAVNQHQYQYSQQSTGGGTDWWTMMRHDAAQTGRSTSEAPDTENLLWSNKIDTDDIITSVLPHLVYDDKIFIFVDEVTSTFEMAKVYCINSEDGAEEWSKEVAGPNEYLAMSGGAAIYNDELFVFTYEFKMIPLGVHGNLKVLNVENGNIIRDKNFNGEMLFLPVISNDKIYITSMDGTGENDDGKLYCLDLNGNVDWSFEVPDNPYFHPPVIAGDKVYVAPIEYTGIIYCLDALDDGEVLWQSEDYMDCLALAYDNGKIYAAGDSTVYCLDADDGDELWTPVEISNSQMISAPAIFNDMVYIGIQTSNYENFLHCVSENGIVWSSDQLNGSELHIMRPNPPIIADEKVFIGTGDGFDSGMLYCFEADTGDLKWDSNIGEEPSPVIANEKLHVVTINGSIYTYNVLAPTNNPPNAPSISGPVEGNTGEEYNYTFVTIDPDDDDVKYCIDWGDGNTEETGYNASGVEVTVSHTWNEDDTYVISAYAIDIHGAEGPCGYLEVTMPVNAGATTIPSGSEASTAVSSQSSGPQQSQTITIPSGQSNPISQPTSR